MDFAPIYLVRHLFFHIFEFVRHWYIHSFIMIGRWLVNNLEWLDQTLALRVTVRHFFEPLYGDYTIIGRALGVFFRTIRVALALVCYPILIVCVIVAYLLWIAVPPFIVIHVFYPTLWDAELQAFVVQFLW